MKKETIASILKAVIALILIAALVFVVIYQNRNYTMGGEISIFKGDGENARVIEGYSVGRTTAFGDKVLLLTTNTLLLLDRRGRGEPLNVSFSDPDFSVRGRYILAYNDDGRLMALYRDGKLIYDKRTDADIISAVVNENGYCAVAYREEIGETHIMIYNGEGTAFYSWNLGSGQFIGMSLSDDNTNLVISSLSDASDSMRGELSFIRLDSEEKQAISTVDDEIYFDVHMYRDHSVLALGSQQLDYYNADGSLRWTLPYNGKTLRNADISNPDMIVLCYTAADSGLVGNSTEVEIISRLGEVTASTSFDGLCENLSVNGDRFAVSAGKKILIYNRRCELKRELSSNSAVKRMSLFGDGKTVFALSGSSGSLIGE